MDNKQLLSVQGLSVWYTPGKPVLSDFEVSLKANEIVGLIGLNGAGKTTFIKTLAGLLDSLCVEAVAWNGAAISFRDSAFKRNRYIVFAENRSFQYFTFREYLLYVFTSYEKSVPDIAALVQGFHFEQYTDVLLGELSTGSLKKAYLITAFALRPPLLLLDEPVNGLDFQSTEYLYQLINAYRAYGTILFSSHILESLYLTADRVLVLESSNIRYSFARDEINAERVREVLHCDDSV